jgi:hypothetical protein
MVSITLRLNTKPLFVRGGMVDVDLNRRAQRVAARARSVVPVKTGALRASIHERPGSLVPLAWEVAASTSYANFIEEGTRYISPRFYLRRSLSAAA